MFKTNSEIIKIEAKSQAEIKTGVTFWSHDRGTAKLIFKLFKDGVPQSIPEGTRVPIRLNFRSETAEDGIGKHDYLATIDDRVNGIVSIVLQDNILGYVGEVKGSIYMDFPDNRSLDTAGRFNFSIRRSPIDDLTPELEDYYFNGFNEVIETMEYIVGTAEKRIDEKQKQIEAELKDKIDEVEAKVNTFDGRLTQAQESFDRIEEDLKQTGSLKKLYSNSIDFGNYDYSGNPNIAITKPDMFSSGTGGAITYDNGEYTVLMDGTGRLSKYNTAMGGVYLSQGSTYTLSAEIFIGEDYTGNVDQIFMTYSYTDGGYSLLDTSRLSSSAPKGQWLQIKSTRTIDYQTRVPKSFYFTWQTVASTTNPTGTLKLRNIKIEKGSTATPYQPNLSLPPYSIAPAKINRNLATNGLVPISNSNYLIQTYFFDEFIKKGDSLTIRINGSKPSSKIFRLYIYKQDKDGNVIANEHIGDMEPVEGLANTWELKIPSYKWDDTGLSQKLRVYQTPNSELGPVTLNWLKIERGLEHTPLETQYRYEGIGQTRGSVDKYLWRPFQVKNYIYSNDINFGNYDYSGNPNLFSNNLDPSKWSNPAGITMKKYNDGAEFSIVSNNEPLNNLQALENVPNLLPLTKYTFSLRFQVDPGFTGDLSTLRITVRIDPGGSPYFEINPEDTTIVGNQVIMSVTSTMPEAITTNFTKLYMSVGVRKLTGKTTFSGTFRIDQIKMEKGSKVTPYQPNLSIEPWQISKIPINENMVVQLGSPLISSSYLVGTWNLSKDIIKGEKYVLRLKGKKPPTQSFRAFYLSDNADSTVNLFDMMPVEGMVDIWELSFTAQINSKPSAGRLYIYQVPGTSTGTCTIEWVKLEKGTIATPFINSFKYRGVNNFVSKNPKDYTWDINNDYIQQIFDDTVSLTKPQTIISSKNFEEVPTVKNQPVHYGPQLFEGWYGSGTEHAAMGTKARLRVGGLVVDGRDQLSEPLTWNEGRYEATVNRDITFYCKGTMYAEMGSNVGRYLYIANWKNSEQTQYASGMPAGIGTNLDGGLYYRNMLDFSWVVQLKQGDKFSIGIELADGKTVGKIQIRTLHIKELVSPTN